MVVLGNDCMQPKEFTKPMTLGPQHYDWGYHGGRKKSQHSQFPGMGYHLLDEPELALRHYDWVREIIETHKNDERICMWDIYNEVGNAKRDQATMPHLKKFFEIAREIDHGGLDAHILINKLIAVALLHRAVNFAAQLRQQLHFDVFVGECDHVVGLSTGSLLSRSV